MSRQRQEIREDTHAGSWYSSNQKELSKELDKWLGDADLTYGPARAIIAPHAGYSYCGACSAHAYRQISPAVVKRIFILGPSHHIRITDCELTSAKIFKTPLYNLTVDLELNEELKKTGQFSTVNLKNDEDEHSIEMHLPYIAKVMENFKDEFKIIPIMVGSLTPDAEHKYGEILAPYLYDPENLFIISSDFCHWGERFRYTYYNKSCGAIHKSIEKLDKEGMDIIETLAPSPFTTYLKKYNNTICGRHPIGVFLNAVDALHKKGVKYTFKFLDYAQSSQCFTLSDSSVSYAAGSLVQDS